MSERETVLDKLAHPLQDIVLDVPDLPPLCDSLLLTRRRVDIGDCELYCETEGSGTPLVVLHGGPGATHHSFHPEFTAAATFSQVIYYDQRGCGSSDYEPGEGYTIQQAVDDLDRLREAFGIEKWVVLDHSYGGMLAQCYVVRYPQHVCGLVLVGASYAFADLPFDDSRQFHGEFQFPEERAFIGKLYGDHSLTWVQRLYNGHRNGDWRRQSFYRPTDDEIARMARYCASDETFQPVMMQTISRVSLDGVFEQCPLPVLIVEGCWDLSGGTSHAERLPSYFKDATLSFFDRSGHNPFDDEPKAFFSELQHFLENLTEIPLHHLVAWRETVARLEKENAIDESTSLGLVTNAGYGMRSSEAIAEKYIPGWLEDMDDLSALLRIGFALYDVQRYDEALTVFRALLEKSGGHPIYLMWQSYVLDLLNRHDEAIPLYEIVAQLNSLDTNEHFQYGLRYSLSEKAKECIHTPFTRVENLFSD